MRADLSTEPLSLEPKRIARSPGAATAVASWNPRPPDQPPAEWQRYLAAAVRFKWLVLGVTLACTALACSPPYSVSRPTSLAPRCGCRCPSGRLDERPHLVGPAAHFLSGWMDLLQSYAVLDDVVRGLRLYVAPVEPGDSDVLGSFRIQDAVLPARTGSRWTRRARSSR